MQHWRVEMRDLNAYRESSYASFSFVKTNSRVQLPIDTSITLAIIISTEIMVTVISPTPFVDFCFLPVPPRLTSNTSLRFPRFLVVLHLLSALVRLPWSSNAVNHHYRS